MNYDKSLGNWNPGNGKGDGAAQRAKLFSTEAHDVPENISAVNELKPFEDGKSGKVSGPLGPRGHEF